MQPEQDAPAEAFWLPGRTRPLAARLHLPPDRRARGGVVLVPALGYEYALAHRALRLLADALAARGLAALRFDHDGTAESWGLTTDPGRLPAWREDVLAAAAHLRRLGARHVALAGLRLGATLAAQVAAEAEADALVLWDPVTDGRTLARRLRAQSAIGEWNAPPGQIAADGTLLSEETLAEIASLDLVPPTAPSLAVLREGAPVPAALARADVRHRPGQPELLSGDTLSALVPERTVAEIADWLAGRAPAAAVGYPPAGPASATVDAVTETVAVLDGMSAVRAEPAVPLAGAPTVLLLSTNVDPRGGTSRAWVEWSRELVSHGFPTLRADLSGIGDSPARPGADPQRPYGPHALRDVRALAGAADRGHGVVLAGLCSGARNAVDAAGGLPVTDLLLVNPVLSIPRHVLAQLAPDDLQPADVDDPGLRRRIRHQVAGRLPGPVWWAVHRAGLLGERTAALGSALQAGAHALVVYSAGDYVLLQPRHNARWALAGLRATGRFRTAEIEADHALVDPAGRRRGLDVLTAYLLGRYAVPARTPSGGPVRAPAARR